MVSVRDGARSNAKPHLGQNDARAVHTPRYIMRAQRGQKAVSRTWMRAPMVRNTANSRTIPAGASIAKYMKPRNNRAVTAENQGKNWHLSSALLPNQKYRCPTPVTTKRAPNHSRTIGGLPGAGMAILSKRRRLTDRA